MFSVAHLNALRRAEIDAVAQLIPDGSRILEIGAGTGLQARRLTELGHEVDAIDLATSTYSGDQVFPVREYDGVAIPWPASSFDVVYSSNLLEHVRDLTGMHAEIRRVLRADGMAVHVLPTHVWRAWTTASAVPDALVQVVGGVPKLLGGARQAARGIVGTLLPRRHGERGNILSETWLYHPSWWRNNFEEHGYQVEIEMPVGYFYTGNMLFGSRLSMNHRRWLGSRLGSACHAYVTRP